MIYSVAGQPPRHFYVWIDSNFTHKEPCGWIHAVWFGLISNPGRAWGITVMLENGAVYRNLPPHSIAFNSSPIPWTLDQAQTWNCYGKEFSTLEYDYLSELRCKVRYNGGVGEGRYLFTAAPIGDGFSFYPEQAKEFTFIQLDNGRLTVQPTNHIVFVEKSFTQTQPEFPSGLKRQTEIYHAE